MMPRRDNPEEQLQRAVVEYLRRTRPDCVWFFVNNGARLSKAQAGKAIGTGVLPGVADLVFVLPGGRVGFIELKAPKGRATLTHTQIDFGLNVTELGAFYDTGRSIEDVRRTLKTWGVTFAHARGRAA